MPPPKSIQAAILVFGIVGTIGSRHRYCEAPDGFFAACAAGEIVNNGVSVSPFRFGGAQLTVGISEPGTASLQPFGLSGFCR